MFAVDSVSTLASEREVAGGKGHAIHTGPVLASAGPRTVRYLRGPHMGIEILRGNPCFSHQMLFS